MDRIWQLLLGIERTSPGVETGVDARLEFTALPRGLGGLAAVVGALALAALFWRLYARPIVATRRERGRGDADSRRSRQRQPLH